MVWKSMRLSMPATRTIVGLVLGLMMSPMIHGQSSAIDAVWKPQRITLLYRGGTTYYSCDLFEKNVRLVMSLLGAHGDILLDRSRCSANDVRLTVTFRSPVEANERNLLELTTYTAEHELIARLNGKSLPSPADLPRFPAEWSAVSFVNNPRLRLTSSDCEFVDNLRRQLLPHMRVRVVSNRLFCSPGSLAISGPRLKVVALVAQHTP